ncbi:MAG: hypothetical protein IJ225_02905 [Solobacterium sp.]|nr:hypothetical protein [Solobacterium sp.]
MKRLEREDKNSIAYTYTETNLTKEEMLGYIIDILNDDDITPNGILLVAPFDNETDWPGNVFEIPAVPKKEDFVETYKDAALSGVTAVMEYHGQQLMLTYRPAVGTLTVILPEEFKDTITDVERNVIPDAIDGVPEA